MSDFDLVVYGATGFTGQQVAEYLGRHAPAEFRWAIAGRSAERLAEVAARCGAHASIVADSTAPETVDAMVSRGRVVLTTAGPFTRYGSPVVESCVNHGVDYVDITGETPWVKALIDKFHVRAAESATRIVPFCGFDSIPSDIGTLLAVQNLRETSGTGARRAMGAFKIKGGINGGTWDTALTLAGSSERRAAADTTLLNPEGFRDPSRHVGDLKKVVRDDLFEDRWLAPFFMAPINTRVVRRSAALAESWGAPYGEGFSYQEALEFSSRAKATAMLLGLGGFAALSGSKVGRSILRRLGPKPGEGPSERVMEGGFFRYEVVAEAPDGARIGVIMKGQGDPGNRVTVALLCQSALLLATTPRSELPGGAERGGILTPATALGLRLLPRLESAGFEIAVTER